jgi:hypothetical protein
MDTPYSDPIHTMVVGVFDDMDRARQAVADLCREGLADDQVDCTCGGARPRVHATNEMSPDGGGEWLEEELDAGRAVVTVHDANERAEQVRELLRKHGATIREPSPVGTFGTGLPATPY